MTACISKNVPHQLGRTVDDEVLISEVWIGVYITGDAQNALDPIQGSEPFAYSPQYVGCAECCRLRSGVETDLRGHLALGDQLVAVEGDLPRRVKGLALDHQRVD